MKRIEAESFARLFASLFLLICAQSCRTLPAQILEPNDPRALALLAQWVEGAEARTGLRGRTRIAVDSADGQVAVRGKQVLVVQRPAQLRVEILGFLNQALAVVVTDGDRFEVLHAHDRSYKTGALGPTLLWDEVRIALTTEEAISVLLGTPVPDPDWVPMRIEMDTKGRTSIDLADTNGVRRQRVSFDPHGHLNETRRFDLAGGLVWRARFDDYREIDGIWLAHAIELDVTMGAIHTEISLRDVEMNPTLPKELFRLGPPNPEPAKGEEG